MTEDQVLGIVEEMRGQYPQLEIWAGALPHGEWVWFARGQAGNPWLVMSADLQRFRRWLAPMPGS